VTGHVADLAGLLAASAVAVAPLRSGSGQLFKVLEALACETPVVATPLALAGTRLEAERHVLVGESPGEFARQVSRLLADPLLRSRLGSAGREEIVALYSWERSVAGLEAIYASALARRRSSPA
jgi:glycosyltransferase involved in cell wall biosynthesis